MHPRPWWPANHARARLSRPSSFDASRPDDTADLSAPSEEGEQFAHGDLAIGASLIGVVVFGTIVDAMLPLILRAFRLDPASASAPAAATIVDVFGLVICFSIAKVLG
jgi:Divalent cation transporter